MRKGRNGNGRMYTHEIASPGLSPRFPLRARRTGAVESSGGEENEALGAQRRTSAAALLLGRRAHAGLPLTGHRGCPGRRLQASLSPATAAVPPGTADRRRAGARKSPATEAVPPGTTNRRRAGARETSGGAEQPCGRRRGARSKQWRRGGRSREEQGKWGGEQRIGEKSRRKMFGRRHGTQSPQPPPRTTRAADMRVRIISGPHGRERANLLLGNIRCLTLVSSGHRSPRRSPTTPRRTSW
jgi:hypothetical protein